MHPAIIIGTDRSLWTWLGGKYHVPPNVFLVLLFTSDGNCEMADKTVVIGQLL